MIRKFFSILCFCVILIISLGFIYYCIEKDRQEKRNKFLKWTEQNIAESEEQFKRDWPTKIRPKYEYHKQFLLGIEDLPERVKKEFEAKVWPGPDRVKYYFEDRITVNCSYRDNDNDYCLERKFDRRNSNVGHFITRCWRDIESKEFLPLGAENKMRFPHSEFDEHMQKAMKAGVNYKRTIPDKFDLDCSADYCIEGEFSCVYRVLYGDVRCSHFFYEDLNPEEINYLLDRIDNKSKKFVEAKQREIKADNLRKL